MLRRLNWRALLHSKPRQLSFGLCDHGGDMPKQEDDKPVILHPMTFEDALKRMVSTPPVNPSKPKKQRKTKKKRR